MRFVGPGKYEFIMKDEIGAEKAINSEKGPVVNRENRIEKKEKCPVSFSLLADLSALSQFSTLSFHERRTLGKKVSR